MVKHKIIGLRITNEEFEALETHVKNKAISKQDWLEDKLEGHLKLLVAVYNVKFNQEGIHND